MKTIGTLRSVRRILRLALFVIPLMALFTPSVRASEEGVVAFSTFAFQSTDVESGAIAVSGTQGVSGITALTIKAFGREFTLSNAQLENLKGLIVNGVQLSSEGGYANLGGRTLYVQLSMGFMSGIASGKVVIIKERGDITFQPIKAR